MTRSDQMHVCARAGTIALAVATWCTAASAAEMLQVDWELLRPTNSGIPGIFVENVAWAPDGKLWVSAQTPFLWFEGGVGIYDLDTEIWDGFYNWQSPLPSQYVGDIKWDASGAAWMGTSGGLVRYDGENWQIYNQNNTPLDPLPIQDVEIAPDGHIWVNNMNAIYDFDGVDTWVRHGVPTELPWWAPWVEIADIFVDSAGHVWATNAVIPGLAEYDGTTWTLHDDPSIVAMFESMVEDVAGNIWMISNQVTGDHVSYFKWDGTSFTSYPFDDATLMTIDPEDGALYCANWHGTILRSTDNGATWSTWLSGLNNVFNIAPQPGTTDVWVGTNGAVGDFTYDGQLIRDYNNANTGIPEFWIDRMSVDRSGYFWVVASGYGVSRFDGQRWRNWGTHNAGSEPYPWVNPSHDDLGKVYEDTNGTHWFGGFGIARWDSETGEFSDYWRHQDTDLPFDLITYFAEDMNGTLFAFSEYAAAFRFTGSTWVSEPLPPFAIQQCSGAQADSQGNVWLGSWFRFFKWDGVSWAEVPLPYPEYFYDLGGINRMVIGPGDIIWLATGKGLVRYDGTDFTLYDQSNTPLPSLYFRGLDVRADGLIGIGIFDANLETGGVALVDAASVDDPASWQVFAHGASPLPNWEIADVTFDPWGSLWVSALGMGVAIMHIESVVSADDVPGAAPAGYALYGARPNPFKPFGSIAFSVPSGEGSVSISVHDVGGRLVRRLLDGAVVGAGRQSVTWDSRDDEGRPVPNGIYFVQFQSDRFRSTRKLTVVR